MDSVISAIEIRLPASNLGCLKSGHSFLADRSTSAVIFEVPVYSRGKKKLLITRTYSVDSAATRRRLCEKECHLVASAVVLCTVAAAASLA